MKREELELNDRYVGKMFTAGVEHGQVQYKMAVVVKEGGSPEFPSHTDGSIWPLTPNAFNSVPHSIAHSLYNRSDMHVLTQAEAQVFIDKAAAHALAMNKDIIAYNKLVDENNRQRGKKDDWQPMQKRKLLKGDGYTKSPFTYYMESIAPEPKVKSIKPVGVIKKLTGKKKKKIE